MKRCIVSLTLALILVMPVSAKNGFELAGALISPSEIHQGGPPRDGIPAINVPRFSPAGETGFLSDDDRILGLVMNGVARAYPIAIMNWHEIVNDHIGGRAVAVTYCPLCGTGMAFDANIQGNQLQFGVSGLLYQSDVLLYDRQTESLWSQLMMQAVSGPMKGQRLQLLPMAHTNWQDWRQRYPDTQVLNTETGFNRDYSRDPYRGYSQSPAVYFDVNHEPPPRYHPKEQVMGLKLNGKTRAYPFKELSKGGKSRFTELWQGQSLTVVWNEEARSARILDENGAEIPSTIAFWFAWYTFYPEGSVFKSD